ncbi:MAG: CSLREA domain-containing protein, partial [Acidobacteria bacterium]|nr:CSLREA domain-containing protein [Acidobacteriota bacterium]
MNSLLTALQSMLRRRAAHLFITLGAGLALAVIATFAWGGVSADSLGKFGITEQSRVGQLIKRLAPKAKLSPAGKAALFATLTVTSGADSGSTTLRGRIASAVAGDTIVFSGVTTVTLTSGELLIDKDLTINGGTNGVTITRSSGTFRIFNISTGTVSMSKLTITNGNNGSGQAGGVQNNGTLTMTDCAVTGNTSVQGGGIQNDSVLTMTNCTISGNTSTGPGGGLESFGTTTSLTNCTISGNSASSNGGAFSMDAGNLNLTNCTVANNTAGTGGGLYVPGGTHLLKNTIVASNTAATSNNISGTVSSSSSYNLIGIGGTGGLTNGTNGNQINVSNPLLDVLASNGGYTQTIALLSGSPALDKGAAVAGVTTDQRGQTRPFDLPSIAPATSGDDSDIGAYEMQVTCNTVTVNPSTLPNGTIGVGYTQTLTASGGTAPYTFAVTAGTLPAGLTLASDGSLSGIPTAAGAASFTITASYTTFGISCTGSRAYTMTIGSCPAAVSFTVNNTGDTSDTSPGNGICSASGGGCTLRAAIEEINALSACTNTINFSVSGTINLTAVGNSTYGPSALVINRNITINGNGIVLQRASGVTRLRQFYVSPYGNLTLNQVTLQNGVALGGNGGNGNANGNGENAGAAAGLGGAIFNEGTLTINRSTLTANLAQGGNGGSSTVFVGPAGGAGGGGMGGDGGGGGGTNGGDGGTPNGGTGSTTSNT